jgi:hypothetical protein
LVIKKQKKRRAKMSYPVPSFNPPQIAQQSFGHFMNHYDPLPLEPTFKPLGYNNVINPIEKFPGGGDIHEHFGVNPQGDILWGTTTIRLPGGIQDHISW